MPEQIDRITLNVNIGLTIKKLLKSFIRERSLRELNFLLSGINTNGNITMSVNAAIILGSETICLINTKILGTSALSSPIKFKPKIITAVASAIIG